MGHYLAPGEAFQPWLGKPWGQLGVGAKKDEDDRLQGSPPLLCWGTQAQVPPKEQCLKTPGQALECRARSYHRDLGDWCPRSCPHLMGDWEGGVKRLHHPIGRGGGHRGHHSCWGWTFLEAEFSTLFPKHTLQCGLILHSEMNHFVYFLYSVLTRGGSPEPSRTEKDLGCGPSME